jgi:RNA 2',3'-cyclic 3'-phosphodiesterase
LTDEPRLFVAVPLSDEATAAVTGVIEEIRSGEPEGRGVRWVRLEGLHVTLRFLGPTPEASVPVLAAAVETVAAESESFALTIRGAGSFPPGDRPRTIWLDIRDGAEGLAGMASRLDDLLAESGWPRERRPFQAHLTIARADGVRAGPATVAALSAAAADLAIRSLIDRLVLFESITGTGRARYVERATAPIG